MPSTTPQLSTCTTMIPYVSTEHFLDNCIINAAQNPTDYSRVLKNTNRKVESVALGLLQSDPDVSSSMNKVYIAYTGSDGIQEK